MVAAAVWQDGLKGSVPKTDVTGESIALPSVVRPRERIDRAVVVFERLPSTGSRDGRRDRRIVQCP